MLKSFRATKNIPRVSIKTWQGLLLHSSQNKDIDKSKEMDSELCVHNTRQLALLRNVLSSPLKKHMFDQFENPVVTPKNIYIEHVVILYFPTLIFHERKPLVKANQSYIKPIFLN